jgi:drug/metabolite transporter (DMT)-like permease
VQKTTDGWLSGLLGVIIFSGSLPATRVAVQGLDPLFLTFARATIAGVLGLILLVASKQKRPTRARPPRSPWSRSASWSAFRC